MKRGIWINGILDKWIYGKMKEYTVLKNINRGYMKLDVWQLAMQLYELVWQIPITPNFSFVIPKYSINPVLPQSNWIIHNFYEVYL